MSGHAIDDLVKELQDAEQRATSAQNELGALRALVVELRTERDRAVTRAERMFSLMEKMVARL